MYFMFVRSGVLSSALNESLVSLRGRAVGDAWITEKISSGRKSSAESGRGPEPGHTLVVILVTIVVIVTRSNYSNSNSNSNSNGNSNSGNSNSAVRPISLY